MIPLLGIGREGLIDVALYSIYRTAMQFDIDENNVARRLVYEYHITDSKKRRTQIPKKLMDFLGQLNMETNFIESNEDYRGFYADGTTYDPTDDYSNSIIDIVERRFANDPDMWEIALEYYHIDQAAKLLEISVYDTDRIISVHKEFQEHDLCRAWARANFQKLSELIKKKDLSQDDIEDYAAYLTLKSRIGHNTVGRVTSKQFKARLAGCVNTDDCTEEYLENNPNAAYLYKKYSDKERLRRLMGRLRGRYLKFIETVEGKPAAGWFYTFSRDMTVEEFKKSISDMMIEDKKEKAKNRKRRERKRKKMGCRPSAKIKIDSS